MKMQMMYQNPQTAEKDSAYARHKIEHTLAGGINLDYIFRAILIFSGNLFGYRLKIIPKQKQISTRVIAAYSGAKSSRGTVVFFCAQKRGAVHQNCNCIVRLKIAGGIPSAQKRCGK